MSFATFLIGMGGMGFLIGVLLSFSQATAAIGQSLAGSNEGTGFQDAITPPWFGKVALPSYILSLLGFGYGFYAFGILKGFGILLDFGFLVGAAIAVMPKSDSSFYRNAIQKSMIRRHADFVKSGDMLRAEAVSLLLERMGFPVKDLLAAIKPRSDT